MNGKFLVIALTGVILAAGGGLALHSSRATQAGVVDEEAGLALTTATFNVANMTCATCPATVKAAMSRVEGVKSVEVEFETALATVVFDNTMASPEQIAQASTNVGLPATPVI